jgi:hypothetical protein
MSTHGKPTLLAVLMLSLPGWCDVTSAGEAPLGAFPSVDQRPAPREKPARQMVICRNSRLS